MALPQNELALPQTVYPNSTQKGEAIPLAIVRPYKSFKESIAGVGSKVFTLDNTRYNVISVFSTKYARLDTVDDASADNPSPVIGSFILIPNMLYELVVSKNTTITNLDGDSATVILNQLYRWDQMQNIGAYGSTR